MKFLNSNYGYADFAVARKKAPRVSTEGNPFTGEKAPRTTQRSSPITRAKVRDAQSIMPIRSDNVKLDKKVAPGKMQRALRQVGRFAMKNKVGVGLAAAGALGAAGVAGVRKMRSDKGKKRSSYN